MEGGDSEIEVQVQLRKKVSNTLSPKKLKEKSHMW
jgi:hypothetical protein